MNSSPPNATLLFRPSRATGDGQTDSAMQQRLSQALDEYYAIIDAGDQPDQILLLKKYADVAEELSSCLETFDFVNNIAPQLAEPPSDGNGKVTSAFNPLATLGDFRIIRELGRGGMGVVYEAEQLSLGRSMALKVLPFAAMLDKQQLKRFKNEARAAATLDHGNIVAVHSVGEERGVHYYAMQLVEGMSLAEVIAKLRAEPQQSDAAPMVNRYAPAERGRRQQPQPNSPSSLPHSPFQTTIAAALSTVRTQNPQQYYRRVAELGIQAARALDHAHQNGILHRDVKPGNLLLDDEGKLYVTDFGLARIEAGASMTITGDVLGTLAYMSPEQALAKRVVIDHRTDIYSLGVTLYELLTLTPPYTGRDRQELLKKIAFDEPRRPRHLDRRIPEDLATIILKAMEKDPAHRYASAEELADDLSRYANDESIQARRPSLAGRALRWGRRHRSVVATAVISTFVVLLVATLFIFGSYRREAKQRLLAESQRMRADINFQLALRTMDELYVVVRDELVGVAGADEAGRAVLHRAVPFYQEFAKQNRSHADLWPEVARAYQTQAEMQKLLGQLDAAERDYQHSISIMQAIVQRQPGLVDYQARLRDAYVALADLYVQTGRGESAEQFLNSAEAVERGTALPILYSGYSGDFVERPHFLWNSIDVLGVGVDLVQCAGKVEAMMGRWGGAEAIFKTLVDKWRRVSTKNESTLSDEVNAIGNSDEGHRLESKVDHHLADALHHLARARWKLGQQDEALPLVAEAIDHQQAAAENLPGRQVLHASLRDHLALLGNIRREQGDDQDAASAYTQAMAEADWLVTNFPAAAPERLALAEILYNLAGTLADIGEAEQGEQHFRKCLSLLDELDNGGHDLPGQAELREYCTSRLAAKMSSTEDSSEPNNK